MRPGVFVEFPQLPPPCLVCEGNFRVERSGEVAVMVVSISFGTVSGPGFICKKKARKRAESFNGAFSLEVFPRIEVLSPLLENVFVEVRPPY